MKGAAAVSQLGAKTLDEPKEVSAAHERRDDVHSSCTVSKLHYDDTENFALFLATLKPTG